MATVDLNNEHSSKLICDTFNYFDYKRTGVIGTNEVKQVLTRTGDIHTNSEIVRWINKVDETKSGKIYMDAFTNMMRT